MKYFVDANIFIHGYKTFYPIDVFPSYWRALERLLVQGDFVVIDKVWAELQDPDIQEWLSSKGVGTHIEPTAPSYAEYAQTQMWAQSSALYNAAAKNGFAQSNHADAFLIAHAKHCGGAVVTFEISKPLSGKKVQIPDACRAMGVRCLTASQALRELKVTI